VTTPDDAEAPVADRPVFKIDDADEFATVVLALHREAELIEARMVEITTTKRDLAVEHRALYDRMAELEQELATLVGLPWRG
jgi:hypothetical protein